MTFESKSGSAVQTRDVFYDYDLRGLQTKARFDSPTGEGVTNAYDGFGRVTGSTLAMAGTSRTIGHLYDAEGNRTRITHPDGGWLAYEYDGLKRFRLLRENSGDALVTTGRPHGIPDGTKVPTSHVQEQGIKGVRPARPDELPR